ncbi:DNA (cytosine-5)-methyltransferase 1B-like isoform X2 [Impatiens glandulifera]|uniref:DNA (cytosine-5)-methyltransferase 1B-like isoform X2 n=1 Tax=Impatiens glandulifera TaxID=253017 RepID=UPI001FB05B0D|nr:DNA (cytosine-5)-methyltransferase 1B-like isoform X2 [Impatiens glandulifera]
MILDLIEESSNKHKEKGIKCLTFGRVETWEISGYEDGSPVVWLSTKIADYKSVKPASSYKELYDIFYEKAYACIEIFNKLNGSNGGDPNMSYEELLWKVVHSMRGSKNISQGLSVRKFIISNGEFIYKQLTSLDYSSKKNDQLFCGLPVLTSLRDECKNLSSSMAVMITHHKSSLEIEEEAKEQESQSAHVDDIGIVPKLVCDSHKQKSWQHKSQSKRKRTTAPAKKYYIKTNEDEIANDYPLPAYYKSTFQEIDEYLIFDECYKTSSSNELPKAILHNWSLYNSDSRLISLELLPMRSCANMDVVIFGSGRMKDDDGSEYLLDGEDSSDVEGIPIYLSAIKEWMIEFEPSMVFISIRTDLAWYRLGKPSKQYLPWFEPVLKTARLAIGIITMLKEQPRVSRLSFSKVIKKVAEFEKNHQAYISSDPKTVERYVIVHGQIILQQFVEFPDQSIQRSSFAKGLNEEMEQRHHTKWLLKKNAVIDKDKRNLNPCARMLASTKSKKMAMPATITKLVHRIFRASCYNDLADSEMDEREHEADEMQPDNDKQELEEEIKILTICHCEKPDQLTSHTSNGEIRWDGEAVGMNDGNVIYKKAIVRASVVSIGCSVLVESNKLVEPSICLIEYFFENSNARKMAHGRLMVKGFQTVLRDTANEREVFLTNNCLVFDLSDIVQNLVVEIRSMPWGYQHRKENSIWDKLDRDKAEDRKNKGLSVEYFCKFLYCPDEGGFFSFQKDTIGLGTGMCHSCEKNRILREKEMFKIDSTSTGFTFMGDEYYLQDFIYLGPSYFEVNKKKCEIFKGGRNVGLKAYVIGQLLEIVVRNNTRKVDHKSLRVKIRRFFRPEDISADIAYRSNIREVYYSGEIVSLPITAIKGKCEIRRKQDVSHVQPLGVFDHIFYCDCFFDHKSGKIDQLPTHMKESFSKGIDAIGNKNKRKDNPITPLSTLDVFAGCGGLSEGLRQSGVCETKWAIEYEKAAGKAFRQNHPDTIVLVNNCNVILRAIMDACGDSHDCISTSEATELAKNLDKKLMNKLPMPGQVDFINGGPPCQGFSLMNRFNQSSWSELQCEMILAFLSFADYYRPKYFLLENVMNFVSFNKGQTFRLTLASLIEMGYQVRFGVLEAGAYGISQSRKRTFIWAAAPGEKLPDWPEPVHVFATPNLKINLNRTVHSHYVAVRSTSSGAPLRSITVRDTIGDLPAVNSGASVTSMKYGVDPISWFQKIIRDNMEVLTDHISKEMNEINLIRCKRIPIRPGADWRDLPNEKVRLSKGQYKDLIPGFLLNSSKRNNQWKGQYGRMDWEGNFPTSITNPQPAGKVGMCFHPNQDRIITVRECARSQGFSDSYKLFGNIQHKHRQIGNAVPPPLAFALGTKLMEALEANKSYL